MTRDEASRLLHVTLPTTAAALKTAFRRRALEVHPDQNKAAGADNAFIALKEALDTLIEDADVVTVVATEAKCDDGTPLDELGKGLGPTTNGRPCTSCRGAGFLQYRDTSMFRHPCPDCSPTGYGLFGILPSGWRWRCPRCKGSGVFAKNGKTVGKCFRCNGNGWIRTRENHCETCHGTGKDPHAGSVCYSRCHDCAGTGEIVVLNPVLPKGLLNGRGGA